MSVVGVPLLAALLFLLVGRLSGYGTTIAFDSLQHSEILETQFLSFYGIVVSATKTGRGADLAILAGVWPRNPRQSMRPPDCSVRRAAPRERQRPDEAWTTSGG